VAAVVVSVVHLFKGAYASVKMLDKRPAERITAFLLAKGSDDDPKRLAANAGKSFAGAKFYGVGFIFDDSGSIDDESPGTSSTNSMMNHLLSANPKNAKVICPLIGYAEVATSPVHAHHRFVINFGERDEDECRSKWPELMAIVERKVKPEREHLKDNPQGRRRKQFWWQFGQTTPAMDSAIANCKQVLLAGTQASAHFAFGTWAPGRTVFTSNLAVLAMDSPACFGLIQSRLHECWTRVFMTTMKDDLVYTPSTCFENFPFPLGVLDAVSCNAAFESSHQSLQAIGERYHQFRAELMVSNNEGLTSSYNRFHDPAETSSGLLELRRLHGEMDQAVLNAYGWSDVATACGFGLDYLDLEDDAQLPDVLQERIASGELFF
jgi:hypothetical protein